MEFLVEVDDVVVLVLGGRDFGFAAGRGRGVGCDLVDVLFEVVLEQVIVVVAVEVLLVERFLVEVFFVEFWFFLELVVAHERAPSSGRGRGGLETNKRRGFFPPFPLWGRGV